MNRDVFLAILALDSYNRGYEARVGGLNASAGTQIGNAFVIDDAEDPEGIAASAGFYGIAYNWNGETIISYRGTNLSHNISFLPSVADIMNGWAVGAGFSGASQAQLAIDFFNRVTGSTLYPANGGVTARAHAAQALPPASRRRPLRHAPFDKLRTRTTSPFACSKQGGA